MALQPFAEPLLEVRDLSIHFGARPAVQRLSFVLDRGETLALVGESGCGKSVTALSLLRLLPASGRVTGGSIRFDREELLDLPEPALRRLRGAAIAMLFQEPMTSLNPVLSIGSQIVEVIREHEQVSNRVARARAIELLDLVRIADPHRCVDDYPHRLSGGMRQRVMIAIAVACRPRLLIADEPTTALDVTIQAQVLGLLDRLRRELSMALLLITHDLGVVADWTDRVIVMYAGRKCEEAAADILLRAPLHPYTRGLIGCSPSLATGLHYRGGRMPEIAGGGGTQIAEAAAAAGCAFAPRCASAVASCHTERPAEQEVDGAGHRLSCPVCMPHETRYAAAVG